MNANLHTEYEEHHRIRWNRDPRLPCRPVVCRTLDSENCEYLKPLSISHRVWSPWNILNVVQPPILEVGRLARPPAEIFLNNAKQTRIT